MLPRAALLLLLAVTATVRAAEPAFELVPAMVGEPSEPVAGSAWTLTLAPDLLASGRTLRLRDADRALLVGERQLAPGIERYRFELPENVEAVVVEIAMADEVLLRWPAAGVSSVLAPPSPAVLDAETAEPARCSTLPPEVEAGREALFAWLEACPLDNAALADRDLRGAELSGRDLYRADLRGADLSDARLAGATLTGALLLGARLDGADLTGADLEVADLGHASLFVSDLGGANLRGADLRGAVLTNTNLANADLTGARLTAAILDAADFTGATCPDGYRTERRCRDHLTLP